MQHPGFFDKAGPFALGEIADRIGVSLTDAGYGAREITDVRPLDRAGPRDLTFFDNRKYADQLSATSAGACIIGVADAGRAPATAATLTTKTPYVAFARTLQLFYADAMRSKAANASAGSGGMLTHETARIGANVTIEPGAVVGREATIGDGTTVAAGAVIGYRVVLGRNCYVGPGVSLTHAIVSDGVIIHAGVRVGQDGFGFAMGPGGHVKVPQIGRVILHDEVEIGANSTIDRGTLGDTVIGAGTKIDNLVQIAHNAKLGRGCVIVAQSGIAGSAELGDFVVMGAQSGVLGHIKIGDGAQIAGMCHVKNDVDAGARMGGTPARPFKEWAREVAAIRLMSQRLGKTGGSEK